MKTSDTAAVMAKDSTAQRPGGDVEEAVNRALDPRWQEAERQLCDVVVGKQAQIRQSLICLLAGGHLLLEDFPGAGKTTLAQALAATLGLKMQRVQFTADLLPADIIGGSVYQPTTGDLVFQRGPIFTELLLADEINRSSPRTQSALLEAMAEGRVTQDVETLDLPAPFFVVATQNPLEQVGTWPLPESQLDRFLMRVSLGYAEPLDEREVLRGEDRQHLLARLPAVLSGADVLAGQSVANAVHVSDEWLDYLQALLSASREHAVPGLSTRAGLALKRAAQASAALAGRHFVTPEDLQQLFVAVAAHRLPQGSVLCEKLLAQVAIP